MTRLIFLAMASVVALLALASCANPLAGSPTISPVYVATANGLAIYNGSTWRNVTSANGLASSDVNSVSVVGSGSTAWIYAGTSAGLSVSTDDGSTWQTVANTLVAGNPVTQVFQGITDLYLVAAGNLVAFNYASGTWSQTSSAPWTAGTVNKVFSDGTTFVATTGGLSVGGGGGWTTFTTTNGGLPSNNVTSVFVDSRLDIFAGTPSGLAYYSAATQTSPTWSLIPLPGNPSVSCVFFASPGIIYVGTANSGLLVSADGGATWSTYTTASGLASNTVNDVAIVGQTIYVGTPQGLSVSSDDGASWKTYTTANGLGSNTVNGIYPTAPLYSY